MDAEGVTVARVDDPTAEFFRHHFPICSQSSGPANMPSTNADWWVIGVW